MVKTKYQRLKMAAERLGVDPDTLLILAAEGSLQLYTLLNDWRYVIAQKSTADANKPGEMFVEVLSPFPEKRYFTFIRLGAADVAQLLKQDDAYWAGGICVDPDEKGVFWETTHPTREFQEFMSFNGKNGLTWRKLDAEEGVSETYQEGEDGFVEDYEPSVLIFRRGDLFVKFDDIDKLLNNIPVVISVPDKSPVKQTPQSKGGEKKKLTSAYTVVEGLKKEIEELRGKPVDFTFLHNVMISHHLDISYGTVTSVIKEAAKEAERL